LAFRNISSPVKFATSTSKAFCGAAASADSSTPSNLGATFCEFAALFVMLGLGVFMFYISGKVSVL